MTKTDIATLRRILALLQTDDSDTALARVLVTRLLVKWDASWQAREQSAKNAQWKRDNRERG